MKKNRQVIKVPNKLLSPDPGHLRGGPSHGYNTSCVKYRVNRSNSFGVTPNKQTQINYITLALLSGTRSEGTINRSATGQVYTVASSIT